MRWVTSVKLQLMRIDFQRVELLTTPVDPLPLSQSTKDRRGNQGKQDRECHVDAESASQLLQHLPVQALTCIV